MKITRTISHLGGLETLQQHYAEQWQDLQAVVAAVRSVSQRSRESKRLGHPIWAPARLNQQFKREMHLRGWKPAREKGRGTETDFVKGGVAVEVQFGKYAFIEADFVKFLLLYEEKQLAVAVEIVPSHAMQRHMSSGPGDITRVERLLSSPPRAFPALPLVVVAVEPEGDPADFLLDTPATRPPSLFE